MKTRKKIRLLLIFLVLLCGAGAAFAVFAFREPLGWAVWRNLRLESVATMLNKSPELSFDIGNYYFGGPRYDIEKAETYIKRTIALNDGVSGSHYQLARIYFLNGDFESALTEVDKEIRLAPYYYQPYYMRGLIYGYRGDLDEAAADFKTYLSFSPESWAAHNDLAWVYFTKGDYGNAAKVARDGLRYDPDNPWLLNTLGIALLNLGNRAQAKESLEAALQSAESMTSADWGAAYPGNDPSVYEDGLTAMKDSIKRNLVLVEGESG